MEKGRKEGGRRGRFTQQEVELNSQQEFKQLQSYLFCLLNLIWPGRAEDSPNMAEGRPGLVSQPL